MENHFYNFNFFKNKKEEEKIKNICISDVGHFSKLREETIVLIQEEKNNDAQDDKINEANKSFVII